MRDERLANGVEPLRVRHRGLTTSCFDRGGRCGRRDNLADGWLGMRFNFTLGLFRRRLNALNLLRRNRRYGRGSGSQQRLEGGRCFGVYSPAGLLKGLDVTSNKYSTRAGVDGIRMANSPGAVALRA